MRRLTACRDPPTPPGVPWCSISPQEYERQMRRNQEQFLAAHQDILRRLAREYEPTFDDILDAETTAQHRHADKHDKRELRLRAWADLHITGMRFKRLWLKSVLYKMKTREWAKQRKFARMIGDLGTPASLQGAWLTEALKLAQSTTVLKHHGVVFMFIKKSVPTLLKEAFKALISPTEGGTFVYFSDDACYAIRDGESVKWFNIDIAGCDGSHSPMMFESYHSMYPPRLEQDARKLVEQCQRPIRIESQTRLRCMTVMLAPLVPLLYSGSTITTSLNNHAVMCIGIALAESQATTPEQIMAAAESVGYQVTVEECSKPQELQFLKHSPLRDVTGEWQPVLNAGVFLRLSGVCDGDLPGRGDITKRAANFQAALVQSAYPRISTPFVEAHRRENSAQGREKVQQQRVMAKMFEHKVIADDSPIVFLSTDEFFERYTLTSAERQQMVEFAQGSGPGDHYNSTAAHKILKRDYGLGAAPHWHTYDSQAPSQTG